MTQTTNCYICYDDTETTNPFVHNPCECKGSLSIHTNCLQDLFNQHNASAYYNSFMALYCTICNSPYKTYKHPPVTYADGYPVLQFPDFSMMYGKAYTRGPYNPSTVQPEGLHRRYYMSGVVPYVVNEQTYRQGKRHGVHRRYYLPSEENPTLPHGPLECEETYEDGIIHGTSTTYWFETGRKCELRTYHYGERHGIQQRWTCEGETEGPDIYVWGNESPLCTWIYRQFIRAKKYVKKCWWYNTHQTPEYTRLTD